MRQKNFVGNSIIQALPKMRKEIFTALDLEMNRSGRIIEVGACTANLVTGEAIGTLRIYVNPHELIDPEITDLTKITDEHVRNAYTLEEAYFMLAEFHKDSFVNCITWGGGDSNAIFDQLPRGFVKQHGWCFGRRWIDVKTLYVSWRIANGQDPVGGLAKAMTRVGLKFQGQKHDALDDAMNTMVMYRRMLSLFKKGE